MSKKLDVSANGKYAYSIYIEPDFGNLQAVLAALDVSDRRALIVTDTNVAPLYLDTVKSSLSRVFREVYELILKPGEEFKNTDTIGLIYEALIRDQFDRKDVLIALGGGVIGDMTGFAAATYMRGIRFVQIPTTLLSEVDSSIGGKTGVDFHAYKNMVGAFHMPSLVYSAISALNTLDGRQYASGMGEVIKHALIRVEDDFDYYHYLLNHQKELKIRDPETLSETVYRSCRIKQAVVEIDPTEKGIRKILNFGHTLGHAIEKCSDFSYTHGQCVALGSLAAMHLSGTIQSSDIDDVRTLMESVGLSTKLRADLDNGAILNAAKHDKKMDQGHVQFILLSEIGKAYIDTGVTEDAMNDALDYIKETGHVV